DCPNPLNAALVLWADLIFVMETRQREKIRKQFKQRPHDGAIINLNIPDEYERDQPELIELLEFRVRHRIDAALTASAGASHS
ncbi:MAG: phosphotyrosine protein phosphatase, partial [Alphaproteobacteria bacterium]|nr:phosphotyrosine protein phosphatase [Alphaproteobacteria bacterium]